MTVPVFLLPVVITTLNQAIRFKEGATTGTLTLTPGTYFLRGDGATGDLLLELKARIDAFAAGNTYSAAVARSADPAQPHGTVTVARTAGASTFQFLWADALTTFDPAWLGFAATNTADDGADKVSTLSPSSQWVSDGPHSQWDPVDQADGYVVRARNGLVRDGITGGPYDVRRLGFRLVDGRRVHEEWIPADPDRAFASMLWRLASGRPAEVHFASLSGVTVGALSSSTEKGDRWHLGEDGRDEFAAALFSPATSLWAWSLELFGRVG